MLKAFFVLCRKAQLYFVKKLINLFCLHPLKYHKCTNLIKNIRAFAAKNLLN